MKCKCKGERLHGMIRNLLSAIDRLIMSNGALVAGAVQMSEAFKTIEPLGLWDDAQLEAWRRVSASNERLRKFLMALANEHELLKEDWRREHEGRATAEALATRSPGAA